MFVRAHRCCYELRAAGREYSYLLLVPSKGKGTSIDVYTSYDTPCSLFVCHPGIGNHTFKTTCDTNRRRVKIVRHTPTVHTKSRRTQSTHPLKKHFFSYRNPMDLPAARMNTKNAVSDMPTISPTEHPRTSPPGSRVSEHMPLYPSCVCLPECSFSQAMATGALEA